MDTSGELTLTLQRRVVFKNKTMGLNKKCKLLFLVLAILAIICVIAWWAMHDRQHEAPLSTGNRKYSVPNELIVGDSKNRIKGSDARPLREILEKQPPLAALLETDPNDNEGSVSSRETWRNSGHGGMLQWTGWRDINGTNTFRLVVGFFVIVWRFWLMIARKLNALSTVTLCCTYCDYEILLGVIRQWMIS